MSNHPEGVQSTKYADEQNVRIVSNYSLVWIMQYGDSPTRLDSVRLAWIRIVSFHASKTFMPPIVCAARLRNRRASRLHVVIPHIGSCVGRRLVPQTR